MVKKELGNVYTPKWIVDLILDKVNYKGEHILNKKVIEPSCGDGAFLIEIVERFIKEAYKKGLNNTKIKNLLEKNIYGIELIKEEVDKTKKRLDDFCDLYGIKDVDWKIFNKDSLEILDKKKSFKGYFDFVVGNPPYISIHNIEEDRRDFLRKKYYSCEKGMFDIYYAFYELGINLLNKSGKLGYITPNTFLHNKSAENLKELLVDYLVNVINFNSFSVFENASTYTAISILDKEKTKDIINYYSYSNKRINFEKKIRDKVFLYGNDNSEKETIDDFYNVQYAITTLADKVFISKDIKILDNNFCIFNGCKIERSIVRLIIKASTLEEHFAIFPYKEDSDKIIAYTEDELKKQFPLAYNYLLRNKAILTNRSIEKNRNWYEYGRSQGLQNMSKEKLVISSIVKDTIRYKKIDKNTLVYAGLFATLKKDSKNFKKLKSILNSKDFLKHIQITGKDLRGGYKVINAKIIKDFCV